VTINATGQWLTVVRGQAPLIVSVPHAGTEIPDAIAARLTSAWLARKDADWWLDRVYDFARDLDATIVKTAVSRTVIDVNRDPSGVSLYPGQATTGLCPLETFDGEPLYLAGGEPSAAEVEARRKQFFEPYHGALAGEIARLRQRHRRVVLYDCHSIRSVIPRLFAGELPHFNIGTNSGASCDRQLTDIVKQHCAASALSHVVDGRFTGGYITRHYAAPAAGIHTIQMELACRSYLDEPIGPVSEANWPPPYLEGRANPLVSQLHAILTSCLAFASQAPAAEMKAER
jgi:N-formylglutamate deformylase